MTGEQDARDHRRSTPLASAAVAEDGGEGTAQRLPRQERGRRRVDEILDAAEALIVEAGPSACSIQGLARRAGASVGSMYHFFPTKDAIFEALRLRYAAEGHAMAAKIHAHADAWARLPFAAFVDRLLALLADFMARTPAYFVLHGMESGPSMKDAAAREAMGTALTSLLCTRDRSATRAECARRVEILMVVGEGITTQMARSAPKQRARYMDELRRAMSGYLQTYEPAPAPRSSTPTRR